MNLATARLNEGLQEAKKPQSQAFDAQRFDLYKTMLLGASIRGDLEGDPRPVMIRCWKNAGIAIEASKQPELKAKKTCNDEGCCYHGQPRASSCMCHEEE